MPHPQRITPGPGQESVWDYPRPPRVEPCSRHIRVLFNGQTIADSRRALRVLETSHPPAIYIPPENVQMQHLLQIGRRSFCEFKGQAVYWTVRVGQRAAAAAAWSYPQPAAAYSAIAGHLAFYPALMDACYMDDEPVRPQGGGFYGGWITAEIVGPFKGEPGTDFW